MTEIAKLLGHCFEIIFFFLVPCHRFSVLFTHAMQMMKNCLVEKERRRKRGTKKKEDPPIPKNMQREVRERKQETENEGKQLLLWLGCLCGGRDGAGEKSEIETEKEREMEQ